MFKTKKIKGLGIALILLIFINFSDSLLSPAFAGNPVIPTPQEQDGGNNENQNPQNTPSENNEGNQNQGNQAPQNTQDVGETLLLVKDQKENTNNAETTKELIQEAAKTATKVHRLFAPLINYFAFQIGNFLGNDYVYQGAMGDMLHKIWVISRNLVNIAFVFYLLWIAVKTIFKQEEGLDELKKNLIVFTLGLIAVNFSWLATKVVLDAASVVTHAVFAIPSGIGDPPTYEPCQVNTSDKEPLKGVCYPTKIIAPADAGNKSVLYWQDLPGDDDQCSQIEKRYIDEDADGVATSAYNKDGTINEQASPQNEALQGRVSMCMESLNLFKYDQNTAVIYLTYGMARIQNLVNATSSGGDAAQLAVGVLMSTLLQIIYSIALGALFIALVIRMLMLWILVAFSPFIILLMGLGDSADTGDAGKHLSVSNFISWAFVPVKVGAVFVVAFIMISAGQSMGNISISVIDKLSSQSGFTFKILGQESLFAGMGSLQDFLWLLMTIAILWLGVFSVLGKLEVVGSWFSRIGEAGKELAVKAGSMPYWAPILPLGKGGQKISLRGALGAVSGISALNKKYSEANNHGGLLPGNVSKLSENIKKLDYNNYRDKVRGGTFKFEDGNKMAQDLKYQNLGELMQESPDHIKAELRRMPHAEGIGNAEMEDFYKALVTANGGKVGSTETAAAGAATGAAGANGAPTNLPADASPRAGQADTVNPPDLSENEKNAQLTKLTAAKRELEKAEIEKQAAEVELKNAQDKKQKGEGNPVEVDKEIEVAEYKKRLAEAKIEENTAEIAFVNAKPEDKTPTENKWKATKENVGKVRQSAPQEIIDAAKNQRKAKTPAKDAPVTPAPKPAETTPSGTNETSGPSPTSTPTPPPEGNK